MLWKIYQDNHAHRSAVLNVNLNGVDCADSKDMKQKSERLDHSSLYIAAIEAADDQAAKRILARMNIVGELADAYALAAAGLRSSNVGKNPPANLFADTRKLLVGFRKLADEIDVERLKTDTMYCVGLSQRIQMLTTVGQAIHDAGSIIQATAYYVESKRFIDGHLHRLGRATPPLEALCAEFGL